jgi:hypothetical protein
MGVLGGMLIPVLFISGSPALGDNSKFHGTFDMTLSGTAPGPWKEEAKLTIGNDRERMSEEGYLHVPASGSPVTNAWTKEDGAPVAQVVTISGDTIVVDEREECLDEHGVRFLCYTKAIQFAFSDGHDSADVTGSLWSDDPLENQGIVTGSLTKAERGGGGGGCFAGTGAKEVRFLVPR